MVRKRVILILRIICYGRIANKFFPFHRAAVTRWTYANARGIDNGRTTSNETRQCILFRPTLTNASFEIVLCKRKYVFFDR